MMKFFKFLQELKIIPILISNHDKYIVLKIFIRQQGNRKYGNYFV